MSLKLTLTPADVKAVKVLTPGPYTFEIRAVYTKVSKSEDKSTNYVLEFIGVDGEAKDVLIKKYINEKFLAPFVPIFEALGHTVSEDEESNFDIEALVGQKVRGFVSNGMYNNRPNNQLDSFAPVEAAA